MVRNLEVRLAETQTALLRGVDVDLAPGTVTALLGSSGAGKTTLIAALLGVLPPRTFSVGGEVVIRGVATGPGSGFGARSRRELIVAVPHALDHPWDPLRRIGRSLAHERGGSAGLAEDLARLGFEDPERILRAFPHELSGGERQRILWVRLLRSSAPLLLLDEPTTGLEGPRRRDLLGLLRERTAAGERAALLVTHDLAAAHRCDQVLVLEAGRLLDRAGVVEWIARASPEGREARSEEGNR